MDQLSRQIEQARLLLADARSRADAERDAATPGAGGAAGPSQTEHADEPPADKPRSDELHRSDDLSTVPTQPLAVIGKYFILETISEGGQATLFRGLHPALLIDVVIKLAHRPWRGDGSGRTRFVSEAKALAEIDHPHLARLYDLDFYEDRPFLVLEYVRGRTLGHYRKTTSLEPSEIAFLVAKAARAVGAAHKRGILHLDLKPENILITPEREPVLIDFGLSFLTPRDGNSATEDRWIAGTPQYMAPEQICGERSTLTQRTDVFGLGGVLYFLCVGHDPFVVRDIDGRLQRPAEPDWVSLARARVPLRLKAICRKALATDPDARYLSAEAMADILLAAGRRWTRSAKTRRWRRTGWLVLLAILSGGVTVYVLSNL
jgi:serine/threonine protein kinase